MAVPNPPRAIATEAGRDRHLIYTRGQIDPDLSMTAQSFHPGASTLWVEQTSSCQTGSPRRERAISTVSLMFEDSAEGFKREELKIERRPAVGKRTSKYFAVQQQSANTRSKAWVICINPFTKRRGMPSLYVGIYMNLSTPYDFPSEIQETWGEHFSLRIFGSRTVSEALTLAKHLEDRYPAYTKKMLEWDLSFRDRDILGVCIDAIGGGSFPHAAEHPWTAFQVACQDITSRMRQGGRKTPTKDARLCHRPSASPTSASLTITEASRGTEIRLPPLSTICITTQHGEEPPHVPLEDSNLLELKLADLRIVRMERDSNRQAGHPYAVQLQVGRAVSKSWIIYIQDYYIKASGPQLRLKLGFDVSRPYLMPPRPTESDEHVHCKFNCSMAVLRATDLADALANVKGGCNLKADLRAWQLESLDRKVLTFALNTIGDGQFPNADGRPWPNFRAACRLWADSRKWEDSKQRHNWKGRTRRRG